MWGSSTDINGLIFSGVAPGPSTAGYGAPVLARRQLTAPVMSGQSALALGPLSSQRVREQ